MPRSKYSCTGTIAADTDAARSPYAATAASLAATLRASAARASRTPRCSNFSGSSSSDTYADRSRYVILFTSPCTSSASCLYRRTRCSAATPDRYLSWYRRTRRSSSRARSLASVTETRHEVGRMAKPSTSKKTRAARRTSSCTPGKSAVNGAGGRGRYGEGATALGVRSLSSVRPVAFLSRRRARAAASRRSASATTSRSLSRRASSMFCVKSPEPVTNPSRTSECSVSAARHRNGSRSTSSALAFGTWRAFASRSAIRPCTKVVSYTIQRARCCNCSRSRSVKVCRSTRTYPSPSSPSSVPASRSATRRANTLLIASSSACTSATSARRNSSATRSTSSAASATPTLVKILAAADAACPSADAPSSFSS
mmetsp:Transcript_13405/g.42240  ORF Transcript_13405/g.42240 Transcript_13405/m.42240 type:complete len:371 (+) Transcript_13405:1502-2614(+)